MEREGKDKVINFNEIGIKMHNSGLVGGSLWAQSQNMPKFFISVNFKGNTKEYIYLWSCPLSVGTKAIVVSPFDGPVVVTVTNCTIIAGYTNVNNFKWLVSVVDLSAYNNRLREQERMRKAAVEALALAEKLELDRAVRERQERISEQYDRAMKQSIDQMNKEQDKSLKMKLVERRAEIAKEIQRLQMEQYDLRKQMRQL